MTVNELRQFPIHDAELGAITIYKNDKDGLVFTLDIIITDDAGNKEDTKQLSLLNCYLIKTNIKGIWFGSDTFDDFNIYDQSELLKEVSVAPAKIPKLLHFQFALHSGSQFDILAQSNVLKKSK